MTRPSPYARVQEEHGSKQKLADKVLDLLQCPEDEDPADFEQRIHHMSNRKLLRLWDAHQRVQSEFGSKDSLVDQIVAARFPGGNADYANKIGGFSLPKLLDLGRQAGVVAR